MFIFDTSFVRTELLDFELENNGHWYGWDQCHWWPLFNSDQYVASAHAENNKLFMLAAFRRNLQVIFSFQHCYLHLYMWNWAGQRIKSQLMLNNMDQNVMSTSRSVIGQLSLILRSHWLLLTSGWSLVVECGHVSVQCGVCDISVPQVHVIAAKIGCFEWQVELLVTLSCCVCDTQNTLPWDNATLSTRQTSYYNLICDDLCIVFCNI